VDLTVLTESELLQIHAGVIDELVNRGVVRTRNNPIGDYTEWLVCDRLGLLLQPNSRASYDGVDAQGHRYQIKGRRIKPTTGTVQLSVIRNLEQKGFDFLIAVVYNLDHTIRFAAKIPHSIVGEIATYRTHVNGHVPIVSENVLDRQGVVNITNVLVAPRQSQGIQKAPQAK